MPTDEFMSRIEYAELWERRGTIWALRDTPGTRAWRRRIRDPRLPRLPRDAVVVLTGRRRRDSLDLATFDPREADGREVYAIFLDDPHPREVANASADARDQLGRALGPALLRRAWEATWIQHYLHELGHLRYARRHGWCGREDPSEVFAERYSWGLLARLVDRETLLAAWGLCWLLTASQDVS